MRFSGFGHRFQGNTGIGTLMRDLADLPNDDRTLYRLGGGNPAVLPEASQRFRSLFGELFQNSARFDACLASYPPPQGDSGFIEALASLLSDTYGWPITPANIALTNGSQSAFFMLFNLLAGDGRRILLPLTPEYIGYGDVAVGAPLFTARPSRIECLDERLFKYQLDHEQLTIDDSIAAICVSRPTNPTGNVLTDAELDVLDNLARAAGIPLIIDNAYGAPFPNIIHVPATLRWHDNIVLSMSLSKLGLPGARTGIIVARTDIIEALCEMNAVFNLAPGSIAAAALQPMIQSGEVLTLSREVLQPFYRQRVADALHWFDEAFADLPARVHKPEGAIFLWAWFPDLPISSQAFYQRLKARGVIVVPGNHFFPGLGTEWQHSQQCLRINIAGDAAELRTGLGLIADELRHVLRECRSAS